MNGRPVLSTDLDSVTFRKYYYLKVELVVFCPQVGLSSGGSKQALTERIAHFLDTGEKWSSPIPDRSVSQMSSNLTLESRIEENIVCTERHRAFFRQQIGKTFTFNVAFQKWLKSHPGSTYAEAVEAWRTIKKEKKLQSIDPQFEYNTYIRDFFLDNPGKSLQDAVRCWNYKKSLPGQHRYERTDIL